jgi:hypothetical protein
VTLIYAGGMLLRDGFIDLRLLLMERRKVSNHSFLCAFRSPF